MVAPRTEQAPAISSGVLEHVGRTPLVRLPAAFEPDVQAEILLKLEYLNPGGSVKDRIALRMIQTAEAQGKLQPGGLIVERTSGNTGVGLAMVAAAKGYRCTVVMKDSMSREKVDMLRAFGAEVVLTPAHLPPDHPRHYVNLAQRLAAQTPGAWLADQFHNPANPEAHTLGTAPEIWDQTGGELDAFVAGCGTGGTVTGIARYLKGKRPGVRIVAADPSGSIFEPFWREGVIRPAGRYAVEGVGEDHVLPATWEPGLIDAYEVVGDAEAFRLTRRLARETGILAGGSSGLALAAALREARRMRKPGRIVVLLPDSGTRYLSKCFNRDWLRDGRHLPGVPIEDATIGDLVREKPRALLSLRVPLAEARVHLGERGVRPLPVADAQGALAGVVDETRLMLLAAAGEDLAALPVSRALAHPPPVVEPAEPWNRAVELLRQYDGVLVRDAEGWTGLDRRDLIRALSRLERRPQQESSTSPSPRAPLHHE